MSTPTSQDVRCPRCSASVRAGSDWCTLCYADLRPAPRVPAPDAPEPAADGGTPTERGTAAEGDTPADAAALPPTLTAGQQGGAGEVPAAAAPVRRGKHARRTPEPDAAEVEALAAQLMAELAVAESGNPLGPLAALTESSGRKLAVMIGGALVLVVVLIGLMAVFGTLV